MKKIYLSPDMQIVEIATSNHLAAGSVDAIISGEQDNGVALGREDGFFWEDEVIPMPTPMPMPF